MALVCRMSSRPFTVAMLLMAAVVAWSAPATGQTEKRWANDPGSASDEDGPPGRWRRARGMPGQVLSEEQRREMERLSSIGYLSGSQPAPEVAGVTIHDPERCFEGLNFYTSGHFGGAVLMDMDGGVLHEWHCEFADAWPGETELSEQDGAEYWRWAHLFENGDVLAIFEGVGLIKVDKDSRLLWKHLGGEHHDLEVAEDGRIFTLTRQAHMMPEINERMPILEDFVTILDSDGNVIREFSILDAFRNSPFEGAPQARDIPLRGDIYHTNAIEILDGSLADRIPAFRRGNLLLSMRQLSTIAVIDIDTEQIVWVAAGLWCEQHDPKVLTNGNIMVFDNKGAEGRSRIVEFDPVTREIEWVYGGDASTDFFTKMCGANHRLPNGNTLITESDYGRAFEVTPDLEIVWEFVNPHFAGKSGGLIATLFDVIRLAPGFPTDWLN
ncbi:MAG: aryl-sulfate sulfotransferase [Candidatus Eisenbacteria bacterium]|nr:aryl-sulfate sulfotransferase [Candidatus Eisenbacteria bacterium]